MYRGRRVFLPLAIIAIGAVILLNNLGVLSSGALQRLSDLWPLLLIILGLWLILNHTLPRPQATLIGWAATAVIVIVAVAYAALAPASVFGTQHATSSQRIGGLTSAVLDLSYGASNLEVRTGVTGDTLYQAQVDYPAGENPPSFNFDAQTGTVGISENQGPSFHLFGSNRRLTLTLTNHIPWTIRVSGGVSNLRLDLRELQLTTLDLSGGLSQSDVQLGPPKGTVGIHVSGGVSNMALHAPAGSAWNVSVTGGASGLTINGQSSGAVGEFHKQSGGYTGATDRFDIQISGGLSHLDFRTG
jgi:Domain of unknown function (DUF5668)